MASTSTGVTGEASTSANKHRCEMCKISYENETFLFSHYHSYHRIDNKHVCKTCDYTTSTLGYLRAHARENHSHVVTYCVVCNKHFNNLHEYKNHLTDHRCEMSYKFVCNKCEKLFAHFSILVTHYKEDHLKVHVCEMCNVSCENDNFLFWHYCEYHKRRNMYVCTKCDYKTLRYHNLKTHASVHHTYAVKYCVICDEHFYSLHEYINHQNVHISGTSNMFTCSLCMTVNNYPKFLLLMQHYKKTHLDKPCDMSKNTHEEKMELNERRRVSSEQSNTYEEEEEELNEHRSVHSKGPLRCKQCNEDYYYFVTYVLPIHSKVKVLPFDSLEQNVLYIDFLSRNPDQIPK